MRSTFKRRGNRRQILRLRPRARGAVTAEFAAALVVFLPIVIIMGFVCYEVVIAFTIYNALNHCAQLGAMAISEAYGGDAGYATSITMQQNILQNITFANIVVNPNQYSVQFPPSPQTATWTDLTGNVPEVVVTCTYAGGLYGLPPFPNPDPLHLGKTFILQAKASAYLE